MVPAMTERQPCGRRDKHKPHAHLAHPRTVVTLCDCSTDPCSCPDPDTARPARKQWFTCTGAPVQEGAPPHNPVQI